MLINFFGRWKYINDVLKIKDLVERKNIQSKRISFINDKAFYTKKNPKTEIKALTKDLNNLKIYALNSIIKSINNILFKNNKILIFSKYEFFQKFLIGIKINNTLKSYGESYKKLNKFIGIENHSLRKKNVLLVREEYRRIFQLQKLLVIAEKYSHGFSRYLNFHNNSVLSSQKSPSDSNNNQSNNNNNYNYNINNKEISSSDLTSTKLFRILNLHSTADSNYFNKKKAEAKNSCFANLYLNACFCKWKLLLYRSLNSKVQTRKSLMIFISKIENIFLQNLNNQGKYHLISNFNYENDQLELNSYDKTFKVNSSAKLNNKKLIFIEEKLNLYTKYDRFAFLSKLEFFGRLKKQVGFQKIFDKRILNPYFNLFFITNNIFEYKKKLNFIEFFKRFNYSVLNKSKYLQKKEALKSILQLNKLSSLNEISKTKNLSEFVKIYYSKITIRNNALKKYFNRWKYNLKTLLNKIEIQEKFNNSKNNLFKQEPIVITNKEKNEEFREKLNNFTNNEFEVFFFKILSECKEIPKAKTLLFLRKKLIELNQKNLNFFFKKLRIKLNMYYVYNKLIANLYHNPNIENKNGVIKDSNYFLKLNIKKPIPSLPEKMGNKIRVTEQPKKTKEIETSLKIASLSQKLSLQRIDYLINQNQSKIILDYENDEIKLDKDINICKKYIIDKSYLKLARIIFSRSNKVLIKSFNKWKNSAFYPDTQFYNNILEDFENVRIENETLVTTFNTTKSDYKKSIQDYKTLKKYFCENCIDGGEEFVLDMKSIGSDTSNMASELKADSIFNSEDIFINKRKSINSIRFFNLRQNKYFY